jgi:glycolate oxidase FAD binding subunit
MKNDFSKHLQEQVRTAFDDRTPLRITAGDSKSFYGNQVDAQDISTAEHKGILEYHPSELVITVRSGTLLSELDAELAANNQMLAFEPPQHNAKTTIGGVIACGLSGPRRITCGAARDFVLGTTIINGKAEKLHFGGQVMKNVAGYDASRLMVGAQGTLGMLLDISLKVLPVSKAEVSLKIQIELKEAISSIQQWIKLGLPVSASCYYKSTIYIRLNSTQSAVAQSVNFIKKSFKTEEIDDLFWLDIKNQTHDFFTDSVAVPPRKLWRCSHQSTTEFYADTEPQLIEWHGALRWIQSHNELHTTADQHHGHATRYPLHGNSENLFQPLTPGLFKLHKRLKQAFDPKNILNPTRLYSDL